MPIAAFLLNIYLEVGPKTNGEIWTAFFLYYIVFVVSYFNLPWVFLVFEKFHYLIWQMKVLRTQYLAPVSLVLVVEVSPMPIKLEFIF